MSNLYEQPKTSGNFWFKRRCQSGHWSIAIMSKLYYPFLSTSYPEAFVKLMHLFLILHLVTLENLLKGKYYF